MNQSLVFAAAGIDGRFRDKRLFVLDFPFVEGSRQMRWHGVWSSITATSYTETGDVGEASGALKRVLTIHATRLAPTSRDSSSAH